jgi:TonB-dependent receptor
LAVVFFVILHVNGQVNYKLSGKVQDGETGEFLVGASVIIPSSREGGITDLDGRFTIYTQSKVIEILVSYIGYRSKEIEVVLGPSNNFIEVELYPETSAIEQVEIIGETDGQVKAMMQQREAVNIKNVVSAEQLEKFPDVNAAEAMARIPGITVQRDQGEGKYVQLRGTPPELTNFNINGEQIPSPEGGVRYVGMDIISAEQIDFIEVTKVLTPDMDADGIGGTVNIITKRAKSGEPDVNASIAGGYNNLRQTSNYQLQFSLGQRFGKFGMNINSNYYKNNQGADNLEFDYVKGPFWGSTDEGIDNYHVQYREVQLRHYDITRERLGVSATLDYELNKKSYFYLRGMYNQFKDDETRGRLIYSLDDAINFQTYLYGDVERDVKDRVKQQQVNTINFGGEHDFSFFKIDYEAAYSTAIENQPNRLEAVFDSPGHGIDIVFEDTDTDWPRATFRSESGFENAHDYEGYDLDELLLEKRLVEDRNTTMKVNLTLPFDLSGGNGYFKVGGKTRFKDKSRDIEAQQYGAYYSRSLLYPDSAQQLSLVEVSGGFQDDDLLDQGYVIDYIPRPDKMREFYERNVHHFIFSRSKTMTETFGEDYQAYENIYAGYAMVEYNVGSSMFLGGIRYERTDIDYQGVKIINSRSGNYEKHQTLSDKRTHEFLLPQFQFKQQLPNNTNIRAALTYTYSRPNFDDVLPYREEDREEVKYGNPDLDFPKSLNIDLLGEKYLRGGGIISGGLFYKNIEDFIFFYKRFAHEGFDFSDYPLLQIERAENGIEAFVYGAELQGQFKFNGLPGFLNDFGIYMNYTYTSSEALINKRKPANSFRDVIIFGVDSLGSFGNENETEQLTLPGQAKHTANFALYFDNGKLYAKLSANYHDAFLYKVGADKDLDEYYDEALRLDFNASYSFTDNFKIFTDIRNLTNTPLKFYLGAPDMVQLQEYYSWWGRIGIKLNF